MQKKRKCVFKTPLLGEFPGTVSTSSGASGSTQCLRLLCWEIFLVFVLYISIPSEGWSLTPFIFLEVSLIDFLPWAETGDLCFPSGMHTPRTTQ